VSKRVKAKFKFEMFPHFFETEKQIPPTTFPHSEFPEKFPQKIPPSP